MSDFQFIEDHLSRRWTILAPQRSHRPHSRGVLQYAPTECPFCVGVEQKKKKNCIESKEK